MNIVEYREKSRKVSRASPSRVGRSFSRKTPTPSSLSSRLSSSFSAIILSLSLLSFQLQSSFHWRDSDLITYFIPSTVIGMPIPVFSKEYVPKGSPF